MSNKVKKYLNGVVRCSYPLVDGFEIVGNGKYYQAYPARTDTYPPIPGSYEPSSFKYWPDLGICLGRAYIRFINFRTDPNQSLTIDFLFQTPDNSWSRIIDIADRQGGQGSDQWRLPTNGSTQVIFKKVWGYGNLFTRGWGRKVQWNHYAAVYDSKNKKIMGFLNGKKFTYGNENLEAPKATYSYVAGLGKSAYPADPNINANYANIRLSDEPLFTEEFELTNDGLKYRDRELLYEYTKMK